MERNERLKAADKCASRYTNENEARIARAAFMLGCEFEAQGEVVKGVILETEEESWKPSEEQMIAFISMLNIGSLSYPGQMSTLIKLKDDLKKLM